MPLDLQAWRHCPADLVHGRSRRGPDQQTTSLMNGWFNRSMQMMKLGMESQTIILQRLLRLQAGGPMAQKEAARMLAEKTTAAVTEGFAMSLALASGKSPLSALELTVRSYRKKVAANRRRLGRSAGKRPR